MSFLLDGQEVTFVGDSALKLAPAKMKIKQGLVAAHVIKRVMEWISLRQRTRMLRN